MNWTEKITKGIFLLGLLLVEPARALKRLRMFFSARPLLSERLRYEPYRRWLSGASIQTVIDIGAHVGSFAFAMRDILPKVQIYSFEPLPESFIRLEGALSHYGRFRAFNVALGKKSGEVTIWQSSASASSSVLPMEDLHKRAYPDAAENIALTVPMQRLDDYMDQLTLDSKVLLKLDVQGYEDRVLLGASRILKQVDYVLLEISFQPLYQGQASFDDIYSLLASAGFAYGGNLNPMLSPLDGSIMQSDIIFVRRDQHA